LAVTAPSQKPKGRTAKQKNGGKRKGWPKTHSFSSRRSGGLPFSASAQEKPAESGPKWGPHFDLEGKPGNNRFILAQKMIQSVVIPIFVASSLRLMKGFAATTPFNPKSMT
jgi:hypothetical protein